MSNVTSSQHQILLIQSFLDCCQYGTWLGDNFPFEPDQEPYVELIFAQVKDHFAKAEPWLEVKLSDTGKIRVDGFKQ